MSYDGMDDTTSEMASFGYGYGWLTVDLGVPPFFLFSSFFFFKNDEAMATSLDNFCLGMERQIVGVKRGNSTHARPSISVSRQCIEGPENRSGFP